MDAGDRDVVGTRAPTGARSVERRGPGFPGWRAGLPVFAGFRGGKAVMAFVGGGIEIWFAYVLALLFLLVRPQGLFGEKIIDRV